MTSVLSCKYFNIKEQVNNDAIVASVGNVYLYKSDLSSVFTSNSDSKDSLLRVNNFIENWARKQIIIQKATLNLSEEKQDELKKMITNYREDLYMNSYKDALVSQNLDSIISETSIQDFYTNNKSIFRLKEDIAQIKHYRFKTKGKKISKIRSHFNKYTLSELDSIYEDDLNFNETQLSDTLWVTLNDFKETNTVIKKDLKNKSLKKGYYKELKEKDYTHFVKIIKVKKRGEIAPQEHVTPIIKQMIMHQKKLEYINKLDNRLIEEAIQNKTFKRY